MMILFALAWYLALLLFVQMPGPAGGRLALILAGFMQSLSLVPMSVMLLTSAGERFRGRVMGVRMLAIYGVPIGLMIAGILIERIGFVWAASLYCVIRPRADLIDRTLLAGRSMAARRAGELALRDRGHQEL